MPCFLRPTSSAVEESVEWQRLDLEPKEVHLYRDHSDDYALQNPSYTGRTSLFHEELKNGNVSLKLTNVKRSDAGNYTCYIPTSGHQKTTIELYVGGESFDNQTHGSDFFVSLSNANKTNANKMIG